MYSSTKKSSLLIVLSQQIEKFFQLNVRASSIKQEIVAGLTGFLTMAYIVVVNPTILKTTGMNPDAVFIATCLAATVGCCLMGFLANFPIGLAPSMGLNVYFAFVVVGKMGLTWQQGLSSVFCAGILFTLLTLLGVRQGLIRALPSGLKVGMGSGIGCFLGLIALKNLNILDVFPHWAWHFSVLFTLPFLLSVVGMVVIIVLHYFQYNSAIILGIGTTTFLSVLLGLSHFHGIWSLPPSLHDTALALQWPSVNFAHWLSATLTFLFVALFDSTGTLIAVLQQGKLIPKDGKVECLSQALFADSAATLAGSLLGTSTVGSYIESTAAVKAGGRTGLTAIIIGICFILALFLAPLAGSIPSFATSPALLFIAMIMLQNLFYLREESFEEIIAAVMTTISIPSTFSIADGIAVGTVSYILCNLILRRKKISYFIWILGIISVGMLIYTKI